MQLLGYSYTRSNIITKIVVKLSHSLIKKGLRNLFTAARV